MADTAVAITSGSGTNIDTRTEATNGNHRQVIVIGDPSTNNGVAPVDVTAGLKVDLGVDNDVVVSSITTNTPVGNVAHDAVDSGAPIKMGAKAESTPSTATLVADGDRTDTYADIDGLQLMKPYTSYGDILSERVTDTTGTSTAFSTFGATASTRNYITTIIVYNSSATNGFVDLRDGTAGSVIMTVPLPTVGGAVINLPVPLRQPTANTALAYDVSGALTTVYISLVGFKSKA